MQTWEYTEIKFRRDDFRRHAWYASYRDYDDPGYDDLIEALNELGQESWEMCGKHKGVVILKRPIDPQPQVVNNTYNTYTVEKSPIDWNLPKVIC